VVAPDVAENMETAESVSMAVMVVLETLTPLERAVFVLREVFGYGYEEIAVSLGRSEGSVRQLAHRAREHVHARRPRFTPGREEQRRVTEEFLSACVGGDLDRLMSTLAPGVRLIADSGGKAKAPRRVIVGTGKVGRFLIAVAGEAAGLDVRFADVNGGTAIVAFDGSRPALALMFEITGGRVHELYLVNNPDKLNALGSDVELRR
jgi:RNA polymerase sigma-70 factor (ECF subfamily)